MNRELKDLIKKIIKETWNDKSKRAESDEELQKKLDSFELPDDINDKVPTGIEKEIQRELENESDIDIPIKKNKTDKVQPSPKYDNWYKHELPSSDEEKEKWSADSKATEPTEDEVKQLKSFIDTYKKQEAGEIVGEDEGEWPYNVYQQPTQRMDTKGASVVDEKGEQATQGFSTKIVKDDKGKESEIQVKRKSIQSKDLPDLVTGQPLNRYKFGKAYGNITSVISRIILNKGFTDNEAIGYIKEKYNEAKANGTSIKLTSAGKAAKDAKEIDITTSKLLKKVAEKYNGGDEDLDIIKYIISDNYDNDNDNDNDEKNLNEMAGTAALAVGGGDQTIEDPEKESEEVIEIIEDEDQTIEDPEKESEEVIEIIEDEFTYTHNQNKARVNEESIPKGYSLEGFLTRKELFDLVNDSIESNSFMDKDEIINHVESITGKELSAEEKNLIDQKFYDSSYTDSEMVEEPIENDEEQINDAFVDYI
jgi:hypothetical protein